MKTPREARISRFLGDLTRCAQLVVDQLLGSVNSLCVRLCFPYCMAVRATVALTRISRFLNYTVLTYDLSDLTDEYLSSLVKDLQDEECCIVTLNVLLHDFVVLIAKWEEPAISALLLTLIFNLLLYENVDPSEAMALILNSILGIQGRGEELGEYMNWYCETFVLGSEESFVYMVLEAALSENMEGSALSEKQITE